MTGRVVGLDLSLTSTGIARITRQPTTPVTTRVDVHRSHSLAPHQNLPVNRRLEFRSLRLRNLANTVATLCAGADLAVIEGPSLGSTTPHTHDRAGLWWLLVARLTANRIPVVEVAPSQVKLYALGKGSGRDTGKDQVLTAVVRRYPDVNVTGNDEADALLLAAMGARHLGFPIDNVPTQHLRAMTKVAWPDLPNRSTMHG